VQLNDKCQYHATNHAFEYDKGLHALKQVISVRQEVQEQKPLAQPDPEFSTS